MPDKTRDRAPAALQALHLRCTTAASTQRAALQGALPYGGESPPCSGERSAAGPRLIDLPVRLIDLAGDRSHAGQDDHDGHQDPGQQLQGSDVPAGDHVKGQDPAGEQFRRNSLQLHGPATGVAEVADTGNEPLPDQSGRPLVDDELQEEVGDQLQPALSPAPGPSLPDPDRECPRCGAPAGKFRLCSSCSGYAP